MAAPRTERREPGQRAREQEWKAPEGMGRGNRLETTLETTAEGCPSSYPCGFALTGMTPEQGTAGGCIWVMTYGDAPCRLCSWHAGDGGPDVRTGGIPDGRRHPRAPGAHSVGHRGARGMRRTRGSGVRQVVGTNCPSWYPPRILPATPATPAEGGHIGRRGHIGGPGLGPGADQGGTAGQITPAEGGGISRGVRPRPPAGKDRSWCRLPARPCGTSPGPARCTASRSPGRPPSSGRRS